MKRILVTGSREWTAVRKMKDVMDNLSRKYHANVVVVHGGARGADQMAAHYARAYGMQTERHKADWHRYGKGAGPIRNQLMVDLGADEILAFLVEGLPCVGTRDCIDRAKKAGIPVREYVQRKKAAE